MRAVGFIPARYQASRFPGKLLAPLDGCTVIERVFTNARAATRLERVIVVTDDARIEEVVRRAGGEVFRSRRDHPSGTDRIGEAVAGLGLDDALVVNVQGDEPLLGAHAIDACVDALVDADAELATLAAPCPASEVDDPGVVKVVIRSDGGALYFSRSRVPSAGEVLKHIGIYAFRPGVLERFVALPVGRLERVERLEQLRALEAGFRIQVAVGPFVSVGIDTPEDLARAARALAAKHT